MKMELDLHDPKNRTFGRLVLAQRDFRDAKSFVQYVVTNISYPNNFLFKPLNYAAVISYSRPFTKSEGYRPLPASYSLFARQDFTNLHEQILRMRNKCVAHSDEKLNKVFQIVDQSNASLQSPRHAIHSLYLSLDAFGLFKELCDHHLDRLMRDLKNQRSQKVK